MNNLIKFCENLYNDITTKLFLEIPVKEYHYCSKKPVTKFRLKDKTFKNAFSDKNTLEEITEEYNNILEKLVLNFINKEDIDKILSMFEFVDFAFKCYAYDNSSSNILYTLRADNGKKIMIINYPNFHEIKLEYEETKIIDPNTKNIALSLIEDKSPMVGILNITIGNKYNYMVLSNENSLDIEDNSDYILLDITLSIISRVFQDTFISVVNSIIPLYYDINIDIVEVIKSGGLWVKPDISK